VVPTWTLPKAMLAGAAVKSPACGLCGLFWDPEFDELNPWHPIKAARAVKASRRNGDLRAGKWLIIEFFRETSAISPSS
jgi:hypothetical protein